MICAAGNELCQSDRLPGVVLRAEKLLRRFDCTQPNRATSLLRRVPEPLERVPRLLARRPAQKIEVASFVRLEDVVEEHLAVADRKSVV